MTTDDRPQTIDHRDRPAPGGAHARRATPSALFGALVTSSAFWKRYEAGLYRRGASTLYVSRGIGVEGKGAPRARFLAPPEVVLILLCSGAG